MKKDRSRKGFTMIEIGIALAVVSALTAASVPAAQAIRKSSWEAGAQSDLKKLHAACYEYLNFGGSFTFPSSYTQVSSYTPEPLADAAHSGYQYTLEQTAEGFKVTATPTFDGGRTFEITEVGAISEKTRPSSLDQMSNMGFSKLMTGIDHVSGKDGSLSIVWKFKNTLGKAFDNVILAIENMRFYGPGISAAKVAVDGLISKSSKNPSNKVSYIDVGKVAVGQEFKVAEKVEGWKGNVNSYSRSLSLYGSKTGSGSKATAQAK